MDLTAHLPTELHLYLTQLKYIPGAGNLVQKEVDKAVKSIQDGILKSSKNLKKNTSLPIKGLSEKEVKNELVKFKELEHVNWQKGRVSGAIYHGGEDLSKLLTEAYGMYAIANPLHPEIWPGVRQMEAEIVSMTLSMYNAPSTGCGSVTSGGTESILIAVKTYRDWAYSTKGITNPEIVIPVTAHAAFDKAAHYFKIKVHHIPIDPKTAKVNIKLLKRALNPNTIMIMGSSPNFPHGIVDDIPALAAIAKSHNIGMHVDACLGGFIVPFLEKAGFPLPHYVDFRVEGVTSISCDPHKYGFAPKGNSVVLYSNKELRNFQYHVLTDWPGGVYASPSIAGSRPGALIAGCWAAMMSHGEEGYVNSTKDIVKVTRKIADAVSEIPELELVGKPLVSVVAFRSNKNFSLKTYGLADLLSRKGIEKQFLTSYKMKNKKIGWHLNILQFPEAIHIACTLPTIVGSDDLINDIKSSVELLKKDPNAGNGDVAAIYGTASSVPDRSILEDVTSGFLDALTMI
ncbi:hypothetical protein HK099_005741 [Clydaea vesicula]|uniref:sphinganine-1-phosphate aldolase n=1 Tax=Clydaea vesicula TaxID=447962 RepID=A0AAD5XUS1_9FUNG|nr:hypothetical protein HK099_005741 [Clydaea vesicula]